METEKKNIKIQNLGKRHHVFGAVAVHPDGDTTKMHKVIHPLENLPPGGEVLMSASQFKYFDDEELRRRVDTREFAIFVDGRDLRPHLAKKDEAPKVGLTPTSSAADQESSVLAEILAEGEPKAE